MTIELEINRNYGDEERAADAAGKAALRDRVIRELYANAAHRPETGLKRSWSGSWAMR